MGRGEYLDGRLLESRKKSARFEGDKCFKLTPPKYVVPDSFNLASYPFLKNGILTGDR